MPEYVEQLQVLFAGQQFAHVVAAPVGGNEEARAMMDAEIAREAERKREIMERSPFAAEHKRRRELSEQGFSFAEATAKLVEEHAAASIAPPNDVPDGGDDDASKVPPEETPPPKVA